MDALPGDYIEELYLGYIFQIVISNYAHIEEVPDYFSEIAGYESLKGVLSRVKNDQFYPDFFDKVSYLIININKGHFFSNGNKRLALVCASFFVVINSREIRRLENDDASKNFKALFPKYPIKMEKGMTPENSLLYHLSILIADDKKYVNSYDELKAKVRQFFEYVVES